MINKISSIQNSTIKSSMESFSKNHNKTSNKSMDYESIQADYDKSKQKKQKKDNSKNLKDDKNNVNLEFGVTESSKNDNKRDFELKVNKETGRSYIIVRDCDTNEIVKEIPLKELAQKLHSKRSGLISKKA